MFRPCTFHVGQGAVGFADKLAKALSGHVLLVDLSDIRLAVMLRKFVWGPGHAVFVSFASSTCVGISYGDEEVRSGLTIGRLVTHVDRIGSQAS